MNPAANISRPQAEPHQPAPSPLLRAAPSESALCHEACQCDRYLYSFIIATTKCGTAHRPYAPTIISPSRGTSRYVYHFNFVNRPLLHPPAAAFGPSPQH